jgi:hypothetical protein
MIHKRFIEVEPTDPNRCQHPDCDHFPKMGCYFEWDHKCDDTECQVPKDWKETLVFPFRFCYKHLPTREMMMKSDIFMEARREIKKVTGSDLLTRGIRFHVIDIFEENLDLH